MLQAIIDFSVKNKLLIGLFVLALIGMGAYQLTQLPIDAVPDITNNQVQIITQAPSLGATDIERLITFPIEQANRNIAGIQEVRSFSRFGLSLVTLVFTDETDIYWARQQVAERLQGLQSVIPPSIGVPELGPISTGLGEIYQYTVRPKPGYEKRFDAMQLRSIQDWYVRPQLLSVKGVAEVSSFGGLLKQYEVAIRPEQLNAYHISIPEILQALEAANENTGGAYIEQQHEAIFIRTEGLLKSLEDIENIVVRTSHDAQPIKIKQVAEVRFGHAARYGAMCYNDEGEVAGAVVMMLKGANSSQVIKGVKERVMEIQKSLPEGVLLEPFLDRTKMVDNAIGTVEKNLLEGALIVIFVLVLFLGNWRAGLLVASVIPLAMLFAIILMNIFGVSGNLMSLGALDFGLIVDGAVIIVEAVLHQLHHQKNWALKNSGEVKIDEMVRSSAGKMMNSAVFGQIIILIVYIPIFSLSGIEGKMFKPMAQTVAFALLGAFLLSLTYIPMMSSLFLHRPGRAVSSEPKWMIWLEQHYQIAMLWALHHIKGIFIGVAVLFILAIVLGSTLGGEFIPTLEEGDFAVETRVLSGSGLSVSIEQTQAAAGIIKKNFPEVEQVVTKIGSGEVPTDPMPMDAADMIIVLKPKSEWTSADNFNDLAEKMSEKVSAIPGITTSFQYPVQMRFNELMTGARQDVVCKIYGENLDTLVAYAQRLKGCMEKVEGVQDIYLEPVAGVGQIVVRYKREALAQYGLRIETVNQVVNAAFAGQTAGLLFEGEKRFDIVVRLHGDERSRLEDVQKLRVPLANGEQVDLSQIAEVGLENGPFQVQREDGHRRIVVGFNVRTKDVMTVVEDLQKRVDSDIQWPAGYSITYGGTFENFNAAKNRLLIVVPIALLLIFLLLYLAFNSLRHAALIYTAIPFSAIGGLYFLVVRQMPFSISAGIGFIALFGVAVLNGIVLLTEFNARQQETKSLLRVIIQGGTRRLRPVLMTAFVASLGFLPMAISNGAGAEVQRPLATVVIGGLLIATFLTLFVLPLFYLLIEKRYGKK